MNERNHRGLLPNALAIEMKLGQVRLSFLGDSNHVCVFARKFDQPSLAVPIICIVLDGILSPVEYILPVRPGIGLQGVE